MNDRTAAAAPRADIDTDTDTGAEAPAVDHDESWVNPPRVRRFGHVTLLLVVVGAVVQLALSSYYLSIGHAPAPHHLPVAVVAAADQQPTVRRQIEQGGSFTVTFVPDAAAIRSDILRKAVYGGLDLSGNAPQLYIASAAGTGASNVIRAAFTAVVNNRIAEKVHTLEQPADRSRSAPCNS